MLSFAPSFPNLSTLRVWDSLNKQLLVINSKGRSQQMLCNAGWERASNYSGVRWRALAGRSKPMNIIQLLGEHKGAFSPKIPLSFLSSSTTAPNETTVAETDKVKAENNVDNNGSTALNFSIDQILQPEFGKYQKSLATPVHSQDQHFSSHEHLVVADQSLSSQVNTSLPSWIFCTRYSDRPSSGPRTRKTKRRELSEEEKRPRTAFTAEQLERLKSQFVQSRYLTEKKRQELAHELGLNECQIKIWFQNKRAKLKKSAQRVQSTALHNLINSAGLYQR